MTKPVRARQLRAHLEEIFSPVASTLRQVETTGGRRESDPPLDLRPDPDPVRELIGSPVGGPIRSRCPSRGRAP
ncbi:hypothetical protein [Kineosporia succinea]